MHHISRSFILFASLASIKPSIAAPAPAVSAPATDIPGSSTHWPGWDHMDKLFVFGASYTSTGFNWLEQPSPSPATPLGNHNRGTTSSNGPNFIEYLTTTFNASKLQTYNFAYPGAQIDVHASDPKLPRPKKDKGANDMVHQVNNGFIPSYTSKLHKPYTSWDGERSLFISFFGINDILAYFRVQPPTAASTIADNIISSYSTQLDTLYGAGARHFLLLNAPPLDQAPYFTHGETTSGSGDRLSKPQREKDRASVAAAVAAYNGRFPALVAAFRERHPDATVFWHDLHALVTEMQAQPPLTT
ncbi:MAG: hypothetical protein L6R39_004266, partial [Caloplaca ligustica]